MVALQVPKCVAEDTAEVVFELLVIEEVLEIAELTATGEDVAAVELLATEEVVEVLELLDIAAGRL